MTTATDSSRLLSLDVLRGLTIAGMIIVNDPGDWGFVYAPLRHASWHGLTPTDWVFPFFLFIVGVSISLAYSKRIEKGFDSGKVHRKIFTRTAMIFGLGLFLALFPKFNFGNLRIPGVLQRIALVFCACSLLFLHVRSWKAHAWIGAIILIGYWLMMTLIPVPIDEVIAQVLQTGEVSRSHGTMVPVEGLVQISETHIAANLKPGTNLAAWIDRMLVPGRLYEVTWDPEGLLSTLPSIGTGILGMLAGHLLIHEPERKRQAITLILAGFFAMIIGSMWNVWFPYNKNLWSSSFVMYTAGAASVILGAMVWAIDIKGWRKGAYVPLVFGANAITAYVLHGTLFRLFVIPLGEGGPTLQSAFMDGLEGWGMDRTFVSLLWALTYTAIVFIPVWIMYRRKIFVKL